MSFDSAPTVTGNFNLSSSSAAVNAGNPTYLADPDESGSYQELDLAGNPRFYNGGRIDIGAYELQQPPSTPTNPVRFVKMNGTGQGASWADASGDIQAMIDIESVQEIRIAAGTYYPTLIQGGQDRTTSFHIRRGGIRLLGGFPQGGGDTRDPVTHPVFLDGNIGNPDSPSDNSYHVMTITNLNSDSDSLVLDGLHIRNGNADSHSTDTNNPEIAHNQGGGVIIAQVEPDHHIVFRNTTFAHNLAEYGGAIYLSSAAPLLENCIISGNSAAYSGGGIYNYAASSPILVNVQLTGNAAYAAGGGIYNDASSPRLINATIAGNFSASLMEASGVHNTPLSIPEIHNSIVWGNLPADYSGNLDASSSYNLVGGLTGDAGWSADQLFVAPQHATMSGGVTYGNFALKEESPAINAGDPSTASGWGGLQMSPTDLAGNTRIQNGRIDLGAFEYTCAPVLNDHYITVTQPVGDSPQLFYEACTLIAGITPAGGSPVKGNITVKSRTAAGIIPHGDNRFVRRYFEITPEQPAVNAEALITLYFTKYDFQHYNDNFGRDNNATLPVEEGDSGANLRIAQFEGIGGQTGLPTSYWSHRILAPSSVNFNRQTDLWEVTFYVTQFSGFFVTGQPNNPLPVTLTSFDARIVEQQVEVSWKTSEEVNAAHFEVERSTDARSWEAIGAVPARGNSDNETRYLFTDDRLPSPIAYYRLKTVDYDGSYNYAHIIPVRRTSDEITLTAELYPNPASTQMLTIVCSTDGRPELDIYDIQGRSHPVEIISSSGNRTTVNVRRLAPGVYLLTIRQDGKTIVKRFTVL